MYMISDNLLTRGRKFKKKNIPINFRSHISKTLSLTLRNFNTNTKQTIKVIMDKQWLIYLVILLLFNQKLV